MKITEIQNIKNVVNGNYECLVCPTSSDPLKLIISSFEIDFEKKIDSFDVDHCQCIASSIIKEGNSLIFTTVTQRNDIDEFINISIKTANKRNHFKLRFYRK